MTHPLFPSVDDRPTAPNSVKTNPFVIFPQSTQPTPSQQDTTQFTHITFGFVSQKACFYDPSSPRENNAPTHVKEPFRPYPFQTTPSSKIYLLPILRAGLFQLLTWEGPQRPDRSWGLALPFIRV